ncbi:MAG: hypothetical protein NTV70_17955 [Acidobacteria bacterium]|nr:hypothetical protein [Acidobacteriota bacterium]
MSFALLAGCFNNASVTELRLKAHQANGREWLEVLAPPQALPINQWVAACPASVYVLYQSPRMVSLGCRAAEPMYASYRLDTGDRLTIENTIQRGQEQALQEAVNRYLWKTPLKQFRPTGNFALTGQGMIFPTADGEVVVSSIELRPLLDRETAFLIGR